MRRVRASLCLLVILLDCDGDWCGFPGEWWASLATPTPKNLRTTKASTRVSLPGGGAYTLKYSLSNQEGFPNSWKVIISSVDGSFSPIVLNPLTNISAFWWTAKEAAFNVPSGTRTVSLTFEVRKGVALDAPAKAAQGSLVQGAKTSAGVEEYSH